MGIYIKDMKMSTSCSECDIKIRCFADIKNIEWLTYHPAFYEERLTDCPLVEVLPHGDLIDREALIKALHAWFDDDEVHAFEKDAYWHHGVVMKIIDEVPTIIPAEEGEMIKQKCPPDYNGGFCADYDVDCKICWEQWEQEHKAEEDE